MAHQIAEDILAQSIEAGTTLPPERELTEAYGVSRGTLREALRILESNGIISIRTGPGGGPVVQPIRMDAMSRNLSLLLRLNGTPLSEVVDARLALDPLTAGRAATKATEEDIASLGELVEEMSANVEDESKFLKLNRKFHEDVARISRNSVLGFFVATLSSINDGHSAGVAYSQRRLKAVNASHRRVFDAIKERDPERAAEEARVHILEFKALLESRFPDLLKGPVRWLLLDEG